MTIEYVPETAFKISQEGRLVYNLHYKPFNQWNTERHLVNDIAVSIESRHLHEEIQNEIAKTICDALNEKYINNRNLK